MSLDRRSFVTARPARRLTHIVSLVVHCQSARLDAVQAALLSLPHVEVPAVDPSGKLIVLLEVADDAAMMERIGAIEATAGVISSTLVFHQAEDLEEAHLG